MPAQLPVTDAQGAYRPLQMIVVGCPGSGKSHKIGSMTLGMDYGKTLFRTTFHSEMTYGDFVGAYKPMPMYVKSGSATFRANGTKIIGPMEDKIPLVQYDFRPGPLVNALVAATLNPDKEVVLVIEEINRANPAVVFGDIIQLLDRDGSGRSTYPIVPAPDLEDYLVRHEVMCEGQPMVLPGNLLIWATMNRADESVSHVDSAFLRRWMIDYIPHDGACEWDLFTLKVDGKEVFWKDLRDDINRRLEHIDGLPDDRFVGPYFLSKEDLSDHRRVFSKLLTYLWHDAVPMDRHVIFNPTYKSMASLYHAWMAGKPVFDKPQW